jgi:hypothetical protein
MEALVMDEDYGYNPDQEEARFYFILNDFKDIIEQYGIEKVMKELDANVEERLYWWYYRQLKGIEE